MGESDAILNIITGRKTYWILSSVFYDELFRGVARLTVFVSQTVKDFGRPLWEKPLVWVWLATMASDLTRLGKLTDT